MTKITRKLLLSIITVVLTVVALGTTTFAWFTLTNTASIQQFNVDIVADTGIEIALDSRTDPLLYVWKSVITAQDVYDYMSAPIANGGAGLNNFTFKHLTSTNGTTFRDMGDIGGENPGSIITTGMLTLPFHFRSNSAKEIHWDSVSLTAADFGWRAGYSFTNEHGTLIGPNDTFTVNPADAMRISLTGNIGIGIAATPETTVYENPVSLTNLVLGSRAGENFTTGALSNGASSFFEAITNEFPGGATSVTVVETVTAVPTVNPKVLDLTETTIADSLYYGDLTIRIWFEGWDQNAYNSLLGKPVSIALGFKSEE